MTANDSDTDRRSDAKTPLLLDGVTPDELTSGFLSDIHHAAESEGLSVENISVETR
jgi:hypothetical protein